MTGLRQNIRVTGVSDQYLDGNIHTHCHAPHLLLCQSARSRSIGHCSPATLAASRYTIGAGATKGL